MRLKKIKLAGFKSFVDPTNIHFPDDMTAIVGPNGCGKSNVIDAVRWVLGESSAKNLRGEAMTDVIFNGSTARKPVSQCSVELVFDNTSGRVQGEYANYNELSVKRLVTREAQSFYFLNSTKCRRRDVTDIFLGTGLGPRSYAIIEQGMISRLIESKPQELRVFIEEAAGISKYKERRRETENRIRHSKDNLERLDDVRGELEQQLEKLKRQASAARRYKELKAKERKYKAEVATIRWLSYSKIIVELEAKSLQQQTDIEGFNAQQRGDEKGIIEYREKQDDIKQQLADIQQQYFLQGTEISSLEQNQIHTKQRRTQIEQEIRSLEASIKSSNEHLISDINRINECKQQIDEGEPESELIEQQLEQAQENLLAAEDELNQNQHHWRQQDQEYNQLKNKVQSLHGQVQATMNMQMRTEQRISELTHEQKELQQEVLTTELMDLEGELKDLDGQYQQYQEQEHHAEQSYVSAQNDLRNLEQAQLALKGELQKNQAQVASLNTLLEQNENNDCQEWLLEHELEFKTLWQALEVEAGWESAFEVVCASWRSACVLENKIEVPSDISAHLIFNESMTVDKPQNTLASKLLNNKVPHWLTQISLASDVEEARARASTLTGSESIVTADGHWFGPDWAISGSENAEQGVLRLVQRLRVLQQDIVNQENEHCQIMEQLELQRKAENEQKAQWRITSEKLKQMETSLNRLRSEHTVLKHKQQQAESRKQKIEQELTTQQQQLELERQQAEEFVEQLEELEMDLEAIHEQHQGLESSKETLQQHVTANRSQVEQFKSQSHQLAMKLQLAQSQYKGLMEGQQRTQSQLKVMEEKQRVLQEEFIELNMPLGEQAERLEELLEQRTNTQEKQSEIADKLADVELFLAEAEKGKLGVVGKIQQMQKQLEATNLECEGFRVRANSVLEQLQEMDQTLKVILDTLPDDANEKTWQLELERTSIALSRLGAVNLAAVEEFEQQSQRKLHLDTQYEDLISALELLENAIRKIDRETRTRFRDTFDKVNEDLKHLFPKVFGGGSAYLDLTDDDLLETGVSIMARPPGKKNSTIHLLSGGEKALTALSLVFAIFRLNPAPFCLLDEVDAPLDDANVGRFCKLVSEMSTSVQFIYITHNKIAMEMAKHLTGVTMAEPGVSRMVTVDVDEAVSLVEA